MNEAADFLKSRKKANLTIVLINIAVYIVLEIMGDTESSAFMMKHGTCYTPAILDGEYYRLVTGMFLHFGFYHIAYNMLSLIFLGDILETFVGPLRYLIIYFAGGIAGNVFSAWLEMREGDYAVSAGASGAIFAVIGAILYIVIRSHGHLGRLNGRSFAIMAVLMIIQGAMDHGVDNAAHIGGFVSGFLLAILLYHPRHHKVHEKTA